MYNESFEVDDEVLSDDFTIPIGQAKVEKEGIVVIDPMQQVLKND